MKKNFLLVLILIVLLVIFGFIKSAQGPKKDIKIGVISPLSGIIADYGEELKKGALDAVVEGFSIVAEDDKCEPKEAVTAFNKLVSVDGVKIIVGPGCGSPQEVITPLAKEKGIVVILPSAASKDLYEKSGGNVFNMQYSLESESKFLAEKMTEKGYKKVLLVTYQNAFSQTHSESFKANFKGEVITANYTNDTSDIATELTKIKDQKFDAIYVTDITFFFAKGVEKLQQFKMDAPVYTSYIAELPAVRTLVEGVTYSFPGDINNDMGAIRDLTRQATELAINASKACGNNNRVECLRDKVSELGNFDGSGISKRAIVLKKIVNGKPELVQ